MHPIKQLRMRLLENYPNRDVPGYAHEGDSGFDLPAAVREPLLVRPGEHEVVPTGIAVDIPEGFEIQIRSRSGLAAKNGVAVLNAPGTIDAGYKGEIKVPLANVTGLHEFVVNPGDRIAQAVLAPVYQAIIYAEVELSESDRGEDGFGSTGVA